MHTKPEIVTNWLPRYTGTPIDQFGRYVLLTTFIHYVELFAKRFNVPVLGENRPMQTATWDDITIVNFGMGSAMACDSNRAGDRGVWPPVGGARPAP